MSTWDWEPKEKEKVLLVAVVKIRGCLRVRAPRLLSWGSWGLFPVSSSPAPLIPSLQYNSTNHGSHVSCQPVWPYGHCRLGRVVWREGPCHVESGDYERGSSRVREDGRILSPQNPPPPSTPVSCLLLPGDCHQPV